jgi:catechol-2,3-dioxygenase
MDRRRCGSYVDVWVQISLSRKYPGFELLVRSMKLNSGLLTAALGTTALATTSFGVESNPLKLTPHHATISVANLDKESQWYASVLGFEKSNSFDSPDTRRCWMVIPGYRIDLIQQKGSSKRDTRIGSLKQGWLHVVFQTPMIAEALKRLESAGTDVQAFTSDDGHLQRLIVHDPEGNEVELHI